MNNKRRRFVARNRPTVRPPLAPEHLTQLPLSVDEPDSLPVVEVKAPVRHPVLYRKRLGKFDTKARPGDLVRLQLTDGTHFGHGLFNSRAEATIRVLNRTEEVPDVEWWRAQILNACRLRMQTLNVAAEASAYRLIHAESDNFPGLVIDRYGDVLSAECFSLGMYRRVESILEIMKEELGTTHYQFSTAPHSQEHEGFDAAPSQSENCPDTLTVEEFGTKFQVHFQTGHKTGFFCDQRENRKSLASFCAGKTVLDLCCYTGGFSLQALCSGNAAEVTGVDLDEDAIAIAQQNAKLNRQQTKFVHADVFPYMRDMIRNERQYDIVVLDPPKLINSRGEYEEGRKKYYDLNRLACQLVKPGGLLLTCSCSGLMPNEEFSKTIASALPPERTARFLYKWGAAPDHPVATFCPETEYLKAYLVQIDFR